VKQGVYQSRIQTVEELLDIRHDLQQSAVDSAIDGKWVFAPAYGPKEGHFELWQYGNRLSSHWSSEAMFQIRRMCFWNRLAIHKLIMNVWHQELVEQMHFFSMFKFHTVARSTIFILYIIYCCFQQWKNYQNRLTFAEVIAKIRQHVF